MSDPRARSARNLPNRQEAEHWVDDVYATTPPWDIGRPQQAFVALADRGALKGRVLDVGCGTGEHALMAARLGLAATGIDIVPRAIELAEHKASERGLAAQFVVGDARHLETLEEEFDVAVDCGLYHVFDDQDRTLYVESLSRVMVPGSRYFMLCFSELQPGDWGPRRVSKAEIESSFAAGWSVDSIEPATLEITIDPSGARAWLSTIVRA
jgi:ubiquinone/menaquinone biosynthesis C-methylase UbiE